MELTKEIEIKVDELTIGVQSIHLEVEASGPRTEPSGYQQPEHVNIYNKFRLQYKEIVKTRGVVPWLCKKDRYPTLGVTKLIEEYARVKDPWKLPLATGDFELLHKKEWSTKPCKGLSHNAFCSITGMFIELGIDMLAMEVPVCSTKVSLPPKPDSKDRIIPIGSIDMLGFDKQEGCFVVCDIKTITSEKDNFDHYLLKQKHAIQMSWYAMIIEDMAKACNLPIRVGYMVILGSDIQNGRIGAWKIQRNDSKWLMAKGNEAKWLPFKFEQ